MAATHTHACNHVCQQCLADPAYVDNVQRRAAGNIIADVLAKLPTQTFDFDHMPSHYKRIIASVGFQNDITLMRTLWTEKFNEHQKKDLIFRAIVYYTVVPSDPPPSPRGDIVFPRPPTEPPILIHSMSSR